MPPKKKKGTALMAFLKGAEVGIKNVVIDSKKDYVKSFNKWFKNQR